MENSTKDSLNYFKKKFEIMEEHLPNLIQPMIRVLKKLSNLSQKQSNEDYFTTVMSLFIEIKKDPFLIPTEEENKSRFRLVIHEVMKGAYSFVDIEKNQINEINEWLDSKTLDDTLQKYLIKEFSLPEGSPFDNFTNKFGTILTVLSMDSAEDFTLSAPKLLSDSIIEEKIEEYYSVKGYTIDGKHTFSTAFSHPEKSTIYVSMTNRSGEDSFSSIMVTVNQY